MGFVDLAEEEIVLISAGVVIVGVMGYLIYQKASSAAASPAGQDFQQGLINGLVPSLDTQPATIAGQAAGAAAGAVAPVQGTNSPSAGGPGA
jgi:hypothetical protein